MRMIPSSSTRVISLSLRNTIRRIVASLEIMVFASMMEQELIMKLVLQVLIQVKQKLQ